MTHATYVLAAYAATFLVLMVTATTTWLTGRAYRRRVEAIIPMRFRRSVGE